MGWYDGVSIHYALVAQFFEVSCIVIWASNELSLLLAMTDRLVCHDNATMKISLVPRNVLGEEVKWVNELFNRWSISQPIN